MFILRKKNYFHIFKYLQRFFFVVLLFQIADCGIPISVLQLSVELRWKDVLKACVIIMQKHSSQALHIICNYMDMCPVLCHPKWVWLRPVWGEVLVQRTGAVTFCFQCCLSLLHAAGKKGKCVDIIASYLVKDNSSGLFTGMSNRCLHPCALLTIFTFHLEVKGQTLRINTHKHSTEPTSPQVTVFSYYMSRGNQVYLLENSASPRCYLLRYRLTLSGCPVCRDMMSPEMWLSLA